MFSTFFAVVIESPTILYAASNFWRRVPSTPPLLNLTTEARRSISRNSLKLAL